MPVVRPVGEARFGKTRLAREGADPVAVKKGVKMLRLTTHAQMIQIGVPHPAMKRLLQVEEGKIILAPGFSVRQASATGTAFCFQSLIKDIITYKRSR